MVYLIRLRSFSYPRKRAVIRIFKTLFRGTLLVFCVLVFLFILRRFNRGEQFYFLGFTYDRSDFNDIVREIEETSKTMVKPQNSLLQQFYVINDPIGQLNLNEPVEMLLLVKSFVGNIGQRTAIRKTWGRNQKRIVKTVFIVSYQQDFQYFVEKEISIHNDILQFGIEDTYDNIVYKTLSTILWFANSSINPKYVHFVDDDRLVNIGNLLFFAQNSVPTLDFSMFGYVTKHGIPYRDPNSKWYVSLKKYPYDYWPPYLIGGTILTTPKVVRKISRILPYINIIQIEDSFIGVLAKLLDIKVIHHSGFLHEYTSGSYLKNYISTPNYKSFSDQMEGWRMMHT